MKQFLRSAAPIAAAAVVAFASSGLRAQDGAVVLPQRTAALATIGSTECLPSTSSACGGSPATPSEGATAPASEDRDTLRVQGDAAAVRIDVRRTAIDQVLAKLGADFKMRYRSSIALNEELNGSYAGSLEHVIARLLDGYNYVIRRDHAQLEVIVFGQAGERATAAVLPAASAPGPAWHDGDGQRAGPPTARATAQGSTSCASAATWTDGDGRQIAPPPGQACGGAAPH